MGRFGSSIARRISKDRERYLREGFVFSQWRFDAWVAEIESRHTLMHCWEWEPEPVMIAGCRILDEQGNQRYWPAMCRRCGATGFTDPVYVESECEFRGTGPCLECDGTGMIGMTQFPALRRVAPDAGGAGKRTNG